MSDLPEWVTKQRERIERARVPFYQHCGNFLGLDWYSTARGALPVYGRLEAALRALREWRDANNQRRDFQDEVNLAVRVVAHEMARQITAAATADQDAATIAWVTAGLRCASRPFCTGCVSCQTIESPHRPIGSGTG
ncbi:hypothetical protein I0C86_40460 [Plantactinospora sp. S1510]|uniref:Uncharacterized protein n=1 Tax=Plantactinospora alkalitolerans TaxID=2789879 RepID=A0ABS0H9J9_9ACTN|nr:hypothetical protein [Plantactinospora alkalitolerans]MBF9135154.1 hypothetical protein [Plantactinospora alkalitolerans]